MNAFLMILECPDEHSFPKITDEMDGVPVDLRSSTPWKILLYEIIIGDGPIDALEKYLTKNRTLDEIYPRVLTKGEKLRVIIDIIPIVLPDRITM